MQDMASRDGDRLIEGQVIVIVGGVLPPDRIAEIDWLPGDLAEAALKDEVALVILGQDVVGNVRIRRSDHRLVSGSVEGPVGN